MRTSRTRRASRKTTSRMMPIVTLLASALFGTICSTARAQGSATAYDDVLQGPRHGYDLLRGLPIEPHDAARAGADYAPQRDYGTGDPGFPAYGAPLDDNGRAGDYPGSASDPGRATPRSSDPPLNREDGRSQSSDRLHLQPDASRRDNAAWDGSQIEQHRTQRVIDLQRDYNAGRISRQSLDAGTAQILQQSNEAIAQRRRSLSR